MRLLPWTAAVLLALPLFAHAAGFDCHKAQSTVEKTVCADPALSQLDSQLASAFHQAMAATPGDAALLRVQRNWLKQRDACNDDKTCLTWNYHQRLSALAAGKGMQAPDPMRWQQRWTLNSNNPSVGADLLLWGDLPRLNFSIQAFNGAHVSSVTGQLLVNGQQGQAHPDDRCVLAFQLRGQRLAVNQNDADCGAAIGVGYGGDYVPVAIAEAKPAPTLLSLKVLDQPAQDLAARQLLGKDYGTLLDTVNLSSTADDLDHLGATVGTYFVRGIANTTAAIVMSHGEQLWIGLLVFDAKNQVRMRYYTNVPDWKTRVPKTIQRWHDDNDKTLPIDRMP
ncbi:lysozyme inhibitor LprI family protein [Dyella silvatica]|uniref:lysozyme inhibitor LprI family protein n=1 Tax=Dyella silvatica TaxID=2992128 RepID=UPI00225B8508|nr:lysozyme inhibitor LprI family protein [Dyella silvatica]